MKLQILGSGGAYGTPRPLCACPLCCKARKYGEPYARGGPSVFVHDLQLLIDTPEDIAALLNRCSINNIRFGLYSHGHPDHVLGRRVWEANLSTRANDSLHSTEIIILEDQLEGLKLVGTLEHLRYLEHRGAIKIRILRDVKEVILEGYLIEFFPLAEPYTYGFLITNAGTRALVIMDERCFSG